MLNFWYFLFHNFHKYIFTKTDFTVNLHYSRWFFWGIKHKNLFFQIFFIQGSPPLVFEIFVWKWEINHKCQEKNKNRSEISGQNSFICPLWWCSRMPLAKNSHYRNHSNDHHRAEVCIFYIVHVWLGYIFSRLKKVLVYYFKYL